MVQKQIGRIESEMSLSRSQPNHTFSQLETAQTNLQATGSGSNCESTCTENLPTALKQNNTPIHTLSQLKTASTNTQATRSKWKEAVTKSLPTAAKQKAQVETEKSPLESILDPMTIRTSTKSLSTWSNSQRRKSPA